MPRKTLPLTDTDCRTAKPVDKDYSMFDGGGLYLLVKASGTKSWRFKYTKPDGKSGLTAFGDYPTLSLKEARHKREEARALLSQGIDPVAHKVAKKQESVRATENSFERIAREWHSKNAARWTENHAERILTRLNNDIFPVIGKAPIDTLRARDLLEALRPMEKRGAIDLAQRARQYVNSIMRYAVVTGRCEFNPAADLSEAITTRKAVHRAALPLTRLPELVQRIEGYPGRLLTRQALQLTLMTFVRSSELRGMRWAELDMERAEWHIPAERMKMKSPHVVPLSTQALHILETIRPLTGRFELVFVGDHNAERMMSENTVNAALRRLGYDTKVDICGHGFRTMASSAMNESGFWNPDAIERQLAHVERNTVRAAYIHKAEFLPERRRMMQWWSDYLDAQKAGSYIAPPEFAPTDKKKR